MSIDRVSLRRRNFIPPKAMPYRTPNGPVYDSGEFEAAMDKALALADWKGFARRRAASRRNGKLRGIGLCCFLEVAGGILNEKADLRFEEARPRSGSACRRWGRGISRPCRASWRGSSASMSRDVKLIEGDSDEVPDGTPSVASRSLMMAGSASAIACDSAIEKGRRIAVAALRGRGRRHRVRRRRLPRRRHRPEDADPRTGAARADAAGPARRPEGRARHAGRVRLAADVVPERLPCLRGRDRSGDRRGGGSRLRGGRRCRHHHPRGDRRRADPWRHRAGARPGARRAGRLRRATGS